MDDIRPVQECINIFFWSQLVSKIGEYHPLERPRPQHVGEFSLDSSRPLEFVIGNPASLIVPAEADPPGDHARRRNRAPHESRQDCLGKICLHTPLSHRELNREAVCYLINDLKIEIYTGVFYIVTKLFPIAVLPAPQNARGRSGKIKRILPRPDVQ